MNFNFKLWIGVIIGWALADYLLSLLGVPYIFRLFLIGMVLWHLDKILKYFGIWL